MKLDTHFPTAIEQKSLFGGILGSYFELVFCVWRTMSVNFSSKRLEIDPAPTWLAGYCRNPATYPATAGGMPTALCRPPEAKRSAAVRPPSLA
jgi:hypothetical protein